MSGYAAALAAGKRAGASKATDTQAMALFCDSSLQLLCGAVSPGMVWAGAVAKGMTYAQLAALAANDPMAVSDLMWEA